MISYFKSKPYIYIALLFLVSISPFYFDKTENDSYKKVNDELFNADLTYLNTIDKVVNYTDSLYLKNNIVKFDTALYVQIVSETIKRRFSYGLVNYKISENWIAALSGKILWSHLSAIVEPNDILKHAEGLCSQQTIVFMEVLRKKGINVRSIGLGKKEGPGHFLSEVHYNGTWRLHDVTKEPQWSKISKHHESMNYYLAHKDSLFKVYEYRMSKHDFDILLQNVAYGKINSYPAENMLIFHRFTKILIYVIPLFLLLAFSYFFARQIISKIDSSYYKK